MTDRVADCPLAKADLSLIVYEDASYQNKRNVSMKQTPVLIAGAGPVGTTLALDLAFRGVACVVIEKNHTTTRHPKMDITNGRSMELFRRIGLSDRLRDVAVPQDHPVRCVVDHLTQRKRIAPLSLSRRHGTAAQISPAKRRIEPARTGDAGIASRSRTGVAASARTTATRRSSLRPGLRGLHPRRSRRDGNTSFRRRRRGTSALSVPCRM